MQAKASKTSRVDGHELDDATLLSRLCVLVARDRTTTAKLLWHLAEVDVRGLYRDEGYSALFEYCVKALHMSEGEASLRIRAARLTRRFPVVLEKVERGELHLSALRALAPVLTDDNHRVLLAAATHKTRREVEQILADRAPRSSASVIRIVPVAIRPARRVRLSPSRRSQPRQQSRQSSRHPIASPVRPCRRSPRIRGPRRAIVIYRPRCAARWSSEMALDAHLSATAAGAARPRACSSFITRTPMRRAARRLWTTWR